MRVNGDDIGFIADEETYATWKYVTKVCGLEFSLGKNYTSRDFLIMNSEMRRPPKQVAGGAYTTEEVVSDQYFDPDRNVWITVFEERKVLRPWKLEGFVNQSIIYGTVKKGLEAGQPKEIHWTDLESLSHEVLRGIPAGQQEKLLNCFFKAHMEVVHTLPSGCNLYIPRSLGGAGVALPAGRTLEEMLARHSSPEESERSRRFAAYLACNSRARLGIRPTVTQPLFGELKSAFKEILSLSDQQVPRMLRPKPLRREQHTLLGGTTFLGYLIRSLAGRELDGGQVPDTAIGTSSVQSDVDFSLRLQYRRWLAPSLHCSLTPMACEHITGYQEHLELRSYIEFLNEKTSLRSMDWDLRIQD